MKKCFYIIAMLVMTSALLVNKAYATHVSAAEITYEYTGTPNTWIITLKAYRDCSGGTATMPTSTQVCYSSLNTNQSGSLTVTLLPGSGGVVPPTICVPPTSTFQCYEEYVYEGLVTLPSPAIDWTFSWELCCRNNAITTLQNPGGLGMMVQTTLNSVVAPTNSSPEFFFIPIYRICVNTQFYMSPGTVEIDGDSIVYSLYNVEDGPFSCAVSMPPITLTYNAGFSATSPLTTLNGTTMNSNDGTISVYPTQYPEIGVIGVLATEYRNGNIIGTVKRDMQINIINQCAPVIPNFINLQTITLPGGGTVQGLTANCGDSTLILSLSNQVQCGSIVPTDIRVTEPGGFPNPVIQATAFNCQNSLTDSVFVRLYNPLQQGVSYLYTKIGNDGNTFLSECGTQMEEYDSIAIVVVDPGTFVESVINEPSCSFSQLNVTFTQPLACYTIAANLSDIEITDAAGTTVPLISLSSNCQPNNPWSYQTTFTFNVTPGLYTSPIYITVQTGTDGNTISNACGTFIPNNDTIAIINFGSNIPVNLGPDVTACAGQAPVLNAGYPGTFVWTLNGTPLSDTTQAITANQSGTYIVTVNNGPSCSGTDTIDVSLLAAPAPALGNDIQICITDPLPVIYSNVPGATSYQWYLDGVLIPGANLDSLQTTAAGTYAVVVSNAANCDGSDTLLLTIISSVPVNIGTDITICSDDTYPTLDAGPGQSYQWYLNGSVLPNDTNQTLLTNAAGQYSVIVTSVSSCTGSDTLDLFVNAIPTVSLGPDTSVCITEGFTLYAQNPGSTYQWTFNGTNISGATQDSLVPTQTGLYAVIVTNSNNCDATAQVNVTVYTQAPAPNVVSVAYCAGSTIPPLNAGVTGVSYQWLDPNNNPIPGETNITFQPTAPGTYTVIVNIGTCTNQGSGTVTEVPQPAVSLPATASACSLDPAPILDAGIQPAGTTYSWSTGETTQSISALSTGTYTVTLTLNQNGIVCSANSSTLVTINQNPAPFVANQTICSGDAAVTFDAGIVVTNGSYSWSNGATTQTIQTSAAGSYTVTVTENNCAGSATANLFVNPLPVATFSSTPEFEIHDDGSMGIHICKLDSFPFISVNSTFIQFYNWTFVDMSGQSNPNINNTSSYQVPNGTYGDYIVEVVDSNGCRTEIEIEVEEEACDPIIPNVITPNADGNNDEWEILNFDNTFFHTLVIFNRWGNEVLSTNNYDNKWKAEDLPDGTYFYILNYNENDYKGTITVIRGEQK